MARFPPPRAPGSRPAAHPYRESAGAAPEAPRVPCPFCSVEIDPSIERCPRCQVDLAFVRCPACSRLGTLGERVCARCGAKLPRAASGDPTDAPCPRCASALAPATDDATLAVDALHECRSCGGVFVGHGSLAEAARRLAAGEPLPPPLAENVEPAADEVAYLRCPCCDRQMNRKRLARLVVDMCNMHGIWFDRGEVARALAAGVSAGPAKERPGDVVEAERRSAREALTGARIEAVREQGREGASYWRDLLAALFELPYPWT